MLSMQCQENKCFVAIVESFVEKTLRGTGGGRDGLYCLVLSMQTWECWMEAKSKLLGEGQSNDCHC